MTHCAPTAGRQRSIQRGAGDADGLGDPASLACRPARDCQLVGADRQAARWQLAAVALAGGGEAVAGPLHDHVALKLGDRADDVEHEPAGGGVVLSARSSTIRSTPRSASS